MSAPSSPTSPYVPPAQPARPPRPPPVLTSAPAASPPCVRPRPHLKRMGGVPRDIAPKAGRCWQSSLHPCILTTSSLAIIAIVALGTWLVVASFSALVRDPRTGVENGCERSPLWDSLALHLATGLALLGPSAYVAALPLDDKTRLWLIIAVAGMPAPVYGIHVLINGCSLLQPSHLQRLVQTWTIVLAIDSFALCMDTLITLWRRRCKRLAGVDPVLPDDQTPESPT